MKVWYNVLRYGFINDRKGRDHYGTQSGNKSSRGFHEHIGETEPYYIISGHGTFIDNDKTRIPVGPGDACLIECGQGHGFENDSDEELVMMALVYNE